MSFPISWIARSCSGRSVAVFLYADGGKTILPDDLDYWGVDELFIEPCCQYRYTERRDRVNDDIRREGEALRQALVEDQHRGTGRVIRTRRWLWNFLEKPQTSIPARVRVSAHLLIYYYFHLSVKSSIHHR